MLPDDARPSSRANITSSFYGDLAMAHDDRATANANVGPRPTTTIRHQRSLPRRAPAPPPPMAPPPPPPQHGRATRSPTATGSAPESNAAMFLGRNYFHCPELDQRMKKYLVRLANETANHLIRDTLEPEHANLVWKAMATVKGIDILRGYEQPHATANGNPQDALKDATCLRGVAQVSASIEEFAMLFKLDTNKQLAEHGLLFNPDLLDMTTLYSLVQPSGDHPRRYVGIKWCLVQSPSRLFRNRDFCYLECQKEFRDAHGRRGWVRSMHSIKMPCCPTLEKSHGVVRASLYRCGLIAVETDKPGVLDTTYTIEMDLKGHFPEIFQPKFLSQRIAALASIDKYLQQQRLSSSPLLGDLDIPTTKLKGSCHFCFREFSTFTRRHICRKCGEVVCKNCSDDWQLDVPVIGSMKVRICTVCSAEARMCHATPRQTVSFDLPESDDEELLKQGNYYYGHGAGRVRRSNSMPEHDQYGDSPFQRTAREPPRSVFHSVGSIEPLRRQNLTQMEPSEYFARQQRPMQQQTQQQKLQPSVRESQAHYRESDFATDFRDFTHGEIRATADITALWTKHDAERLANQNGALVQPHTETSRGRRPSHAAQMRRATEALVAKSPDIQQFRSRIPSDVSGRSVFRESALPDADYGRNGHFPPSARYAVVGDRLERSNSFDAGRQYEEQQHLHQHDHRPSTHHQAQRPYQGNSRRSPQPLNGSYSPQNEYPSSSRSTSAIYQSPDRPTRKARAQSSRQNLEYQQPQRQAESRQQQAPASRNVALDFARQPQAQSTAPTSRNVALDFARQPQVPQSNTTPRNIAMEFAHQSQANTTPRNIALEFASNQSQASSSTTTTPRNIALEFATQSNTTPRNVALEFVKFQQMPPSRLPEVPAFNFGGAKVPWAQMVDDQPEPPHSPDMIGGAEPVEYVETDSGEWIASDRWGKGPLVPPPNMDLEGEPLETRECEHCGAKQYVHEGIVEATCDCDIDDELTRPSTLNANRDESRVSFRVEQNLFESNESFIDPVRSQNESFGGEKIRVSSDLDQVLPLLVDQLSQHSLRSSFHHT